MLHIYLAMIETQEDKLRFEQLYVLHREVMLRVARGILRNEPDAEDAVHQAFLRIASDMTKIDDVSCHQTRHFLVIIVRRLALNLHAERRKAVVLSLEELDPTENFFSDTDPALEQIERDDLYQTLQQLPTIHRDVLYLMYYEELSVKEIAKAIDITESAAKKRLERARRAMREAIVFEGKTTQ